MIQFILSLRIHGFDLARSARERCARQIELIQSADLIVAGARQSVLRGDDFDVGGDPGLKAALRLSHFFLRQLQTQIGNVHGITRGRELIESGLYFIHDLRFQLAANFRHVLFFQLGARLFGVDSAAGEDWKLQRELVGVGRNAIVEAAIPGRTRIPKNPVAGRRCSPAASVVNLAMRCCEFKRTNLRPRG